MNFFSEHGKELYENILNQNSMPKNTYIITLRIETVATIGQTWLNDSIKKANKKHKGKVSILSGEIIAD